MKQDGPMKKNKSMSIGITTKVTKRPHMKIMEKIRLKIVEKLKNKIGPQFS